MSPANLSTYLDVIQNYDPDSDKKETKPGYLPKLGLVDFMIQMIRTQDFEPLIMMARFLNMACFKLPSGKTTKDCASRALAKKSQVASKECADSFNSIIEGLSGDGIVDSKEAAKTVKECDEAISALCAMRAEAVSIRDRKIHK
ncbi:MAG: hypothetical protein GY729_21550 [Desulfobacteraceae bacterium]|nr:hypothetical protein [Desulfobacteraceae bacterium]